MSAIDSINAWFYETKITIGLIAYFMAAIYIIQA